MAGGKKRAMLKKAMAKGNRKADAFARRLSGSGRDGGPLLLWGILHVKIIRCRELKNLDFSLLNRNQKSDPYVIASIGPTRILKTTIKMDDLNPLYNEEFYCYVAHKASGITFKVVDMDDMTADDTIGKYTLNVRELVRLPSDEHWLMPEMARQDDLLRTGVHKEVYLSGKKKNGSLELFVEFVPKHMLGRTMEVPGVYFPATDGNDVKFYVNADDDGTAPKVTYGGPGDNAKTFRPGRLWRDIYDAMCEARHMIYVVGWSVDVDQYLLRGDERDAALSGRYSPQIGPLLSAKADEGVVVNLMQWDDFSSNIFNPGGKMGTHDEKTRDFFRNTRVNAEFMGTKGDGTNTMWQGQNKTMFFTHHQKFVVCDAPRKDGSGERELLAFVGGIDLTEGRWDNRQHPLFRGLDTVFHGDCYNKCYRFNDKKVGPRQPWHDIHSAVRGPEALHLVRAFRERWLSQAPREKISCLIEMESLGFNPQTLTNDGGWHCQLSRSIDKRVSEFDRTVYQTFRNLGPDEMKPQSAAWKSFEEKDAALARKFETSTYERLSFNRTLDQKKGRDVDKSIELTNIHYIRRAKHFIYIESQYFLSSSHMWSIESNRSVKCSNLIAIELALKICEKIAMGERFAVYILLPMWCEGLPDSEANQEILFWQWSTIEMMHRVVQEAIDDRCRNSSDHGLELSDYLNFYCLGNREAKDGSETPTVPRSPDEKLLSETRRHQIYVHSKFMVVDDEVALIGTANVNQRSMDGCRDTEIMMTAWHPDHLATEASIARGDVHGYRMHCWATLTNQMLPEFRDPKSVECVHAMNRIAESNWQRYSANETSEMNSHLLSPPLKYYGKGGGLSARIDMPKGLFLDTKASVKGKDSRHFPDIILT